MRASLSLLLLLSLGCTREVERAPFGPLPLCRDTRYIPYCPEVKPHFGEDPPFCSEEPQPLCKLIDIGLRNNPLTCQSWANAEAAYFALKSSQGAYYPQIGVEAAYGAIDSSVGNSSFGSSTVNSATGGINSVGPGGLRTGVFTESLTLSWLLMDFGGREYNVEVQKEGLLANNWTHNQVLQQVVFNVVQAYYQAIATDEEVRAKEADLRDAKKTEESSRVQFEAGLVNKVDYLQAESARWKAELALQQAYGDRATAYATVAEAAGLPPETKLTLVPFPEDLSFIQLEETLCSLIARAKLERDDLQSLMASYRQAGAVIGVARSALFPQLVGLVDLQGDRYEGGPLRKSHSYYSAVALTWNIFTGFSDTYNLYQAKSNQKSAYATWKAQEQQIVLNVIQGYNQFEVAQSSLYTSAQYLKYATEAYDAASMGYKAGLNTIVDVLNSQSTLAEARLQDIQSRSGLLTASANLSFATGTLFQTPSLCR